MEKKLSTIVSISILALCLSSCSYLKEQMDLNNAPPPGKYEKTVSSTDTKGTTTERKSSTEVGVDKDGNKKTVVKSKTTKDPKGLFNKTTTSQSKQETEEKQ